MIVFRQKEYVSISKKIPVYLRKFKRNSVKEARESIKNVKNAVELAPQSPGLAARQLAGEAVNMAPIAGPLLPMIPGTTEAGIAIREFAPSVKGKRVRYQKVPGETTGQGYRRKFLNGLHEASKAAGDVIETGGNLIGAALKSIPT